MIFKKDYLYIPINHNWFSVCNNINSKKRVFLFVCIFLFFVLIFLKAKSQPKEEPYNCEELVEALVKDKFLAITGNNGRLGNQLWTFASGWSYAKELNRTFYISNYDKNISKSIEEQRIVVEKIFPRLKELYVYIKPYKEKLVIHNTNKDNWCHYQNPLEHRNETSKFLLLESEYAQHIHSFYKYKYEFLSYLEFSEDIKQAGEKYIKENNLDSENNVCVHVRRTDFTHLNLSVSQENVISLVEFVIKEQGPSRLVFFGDDPEFLNKTLTTLRQMNSKLYTKDSLVNLSEPGVVMYLASRICNSFLITSQATTFGFWSAFLTRNWKKVYFYYIPEHEPTLYCQGLLLPWNPLSMINDKIQRISLKGE